MSNKRHYHRIKIKVPLLFFIPLLKKEFEGATINISGTGLAFVTQQPVSEGQNLIIKLFLPGQQEATIQVRVVWVHNSEEGARSAQWFKVGVRLDEELLYDSKKYLKFYSEELLRASREITGN